MIEESLLRSLGMVVIAAALCAVIARYLWLPALAGYLAAGLLLGPATGFLVVSEPLQLISETGIVLLLFLVGLELSLDKIRDVGRIALYAGVSQVLLTAAAASGLCFGLGFGRAESLFLAMGLTLSSTVVVVKLLEEKRESGTRHGRIAVGVLLVQDLVVIALLTMLTVFRDQSSPDLGVLAKSLAGAALGMAALMVVTWLIARHALRRPFGWASRSPDTLFIWSLCWCFLVLLGAHLLHLSHEIGAFLAGITLAQFPYNHDLRRRVHPLMNFFIAIFFVTLGVQMDLAAAAAQWKVVLLFVGFALVGKLVLMGLIGRLLRLTAATSFLTAVALAQISEFSFILASLGADAGMIDRKIFSLLGAVGLVSIAVSAAMIFYNQGLLRFADRTRILRLFGSVHGEPEEAEGEEWSGHVIVVGMNTLGRELVRRLHDAGERTLAIDTDPAKLADLPGGTLIGNAEYLSVLEAAGLHQAKLLVSALHIEEANDLLAYRCRIAQIPCSIHGIDISVVDNLLEMGVAYLMIPKIDGVKLQTRELQKMGVIKK